MLSGGGWVDQYRINEFSHWTRPDAWRIIRPHALTVAVKAVRH